MPISVACLRCQLQKRTYALRAQAARMWAHAMTMTRDRDAIKTTQASRRPTGCCRQTNCTIRHAGRRCWVDALASRLTENWERA